MEKRTLFKAYAIKFVINVSGQAGEFNLLPLFLTVGSGIGLMSLSVIFADCVMLHCTKDRKLFKKVKVVRIDEKMDMVDVDPL